MCTILNEMSGNTDAFRQVLRAHHDLRHEEKVEHTQVTLVLEKRAQMAVF